MPRGKVPQGHSLLVQWYLEVGPLRGRGCLKCFLSGSVLSILSAPRALFFFWFLVNQHPKFHTSGLWSNKVCSYYKDRATESNSPITAKPNFYFWCHLLLQNSFVRQPPRRHGHSQRAMRGPQRRLAREGETGHPAPLPGKRRPRRGHTEQPEGWAGRPTWHTYFLPPQRRRGFCFVRPPPESGWGES